MLLFALLLVLSAPNVSFAFNPREYEKKYVTCKAINRAENNREVDNTLSYVDINPSAERTLVMVHGWPSLWSSWSKQIEEFKNDYRLIVVDQRGFGESTHPDDIKSSGTMFDLSGDLICILKNASIEKAICVGHDWGSQVCYESARLRPDIFEGVVGTVVPYIPAAGPYVPIKHLVSALPKLRYQLFFDENTSAAIEELDKDIRRTLRATLRTKKSAPPDLFLTSPSSFLAAWDDIKEIPSIPFFTAEEEDYFVEGYKRQGFKYTLQFYTDENRHASWELANEQGNHTIPIPVLAIYPTDDPVADWEVAAKLLHSNDFLPKLTVERVGGAHWVHLENPEPVNTAMRRWLELTYGSEIKQDRPIDEL